MISECEIGCYCSTLKKNGRLLDSDDRWLPQPCAKTTLIFLLLRRRFGGFSSRTGDTMHRWRWNFVWKSQPWSTPPRQISPHRCVRGGKGTGAPKTENFSKFWHIKQHAGAYPSGDFYEIFSICEPLYDWLDIKICLNSLQGLTSYGV